MQDHGVETDVNSRPFVKPGDKTGRVFGTGKFFLEIMEAEAVVNALVEDAAEFAVAFKDNDTEAQTAAFKGRGKAGGAAADYGHVVIQGRLLWGKSSRINEPLLSWRTAVSSTP